MSLNAQGVRKITMLEKEDTYVVIIGLQGETAHYFGTPFGWNRFFYRITSRHSLLVFRLLHEDSITTKTSSCRHWHHRCCCCLAVSDTVILLLLLLPVQVRTAAVTVGAMLLSLLLLSYFLCYRQFKFSLAPSLFLPSCCWFCGWFLFACLRQPGGGLPGGD